MTRYAYTDASASVFGSATGCYMIVGELPVTIMLECANDSLLAEAETILKLLAVWGKESEDEYSLCESGENDLRSSGGSSSFIQEYKSLIRKPPPKPRPLRKSKSSDSGLDKLVQRKYIILACVVIDEHALERNESGEFERTTPQVKHVIRTDRKDLVDALQHYDMMLHCTTRRKKRSKEKIARFQKILDIVAKIRELDPDVVLEHVHNCKHGVIGDPCNYIVDKFARKAHRGERIPEIEYIADSRVYVMDGKSFQTP